MAAMTLDMAKMMRMLCAIALLCVGFAHKAPVLALPLSPAEMAFYALPDGTNPVLCLSGQDDDGKHPAQDFGTGCEACRLTASVILPTPVDATGLTIAAVVDRHRPVRHEAFYRQLFPPNATPRGPPAGLIA